VSKARRPLIVVWMLLSLAGALKLGEQGHLVLPHLRYGHVMFNQNLHTVHVYEYAGADGVRHPLADLVATPSLGYHRARLVVNMIIKPDYIREICFRALRASGNQPLTFYIDQYDVDVDARRPSKTETLSCDDKTFAPK
jgi:hypothetical protein